MQYCDRGEIDASNRDHPGAMTFQQLQNVQFESERNIPFILAEQRGHPAEIVMNFMTYRGSARSSGRCLCSVAWKLALQLC